MVGDTVMGRQGVPMGFRESAYACVVGKTLFGALTLAAVCTVAGCGSAAPAAPAASPTVDADNVADQGACRAFDQSMHSVVDLDQHLSSGLPAPIEDEAVQAARSGVDNAAALATGGLADTMRRTSAALVVMRAKATSGSVQLAPVDLSAEMGTVRTLANTVTGMCAQDGVTMVNQVP
jgi:hypothetical protein